MKNIKMKNIKKDITKKLTNIVRRLDEAKKNKTPLPQGEINATRDLLNRLKNLNLPEDKKAVMKKIVDLSLPILDEMEEMNKQKQKQKPLDLLTEEESLFLDSLRETTSLLESKKAMECSSVEEKTLLIDHANNQLAEAQNLVSKQQINKQAGIISELLEDWYLALEKQEQELEEEQEHFEQEQELEEQELEEQELEEQPGHFDLDAFLLAPESYEEYEEAGKVINLKMDDSMEEILSIIKESLPQGEKKSFYEVFGALWEECFFNKTSCLPWGEYMPSIEELEEKGYISIETVLNENGAIVCHNVTNKKIA